MSNQMTTLVAAPTQTYAAAFAATKQLEAYFTAEGITVADKDAPMSAAHIETANKFIAKENLANTTEVSQLVKANYSALPKAAQRGKVLVARTIKDKSIAAERGVTNYDTVVCFKVAQTSATGFVESRTGDKQYAKGKGGPAVKFFDLCDENGLDIPQLDFMLSDTGYPTTDNNYGRFADLQNKEVRVSCNIEDSSGVKRYNRDAFFNSITKGGSLPLDTDEQIQLGNHFDKYAVTVGKQQILVVEMPVSANPDVNMLAFRDSSEEHVKDMQEVFADRKAGRKQLRAMRLKKANEAKAAQFESAEIREAKVKAKAEAAAKLGGFAQIRQDYPDLPFEQQKELFELMMMS